MSKIKKAVQVEYTVKYNHSVIVEIEEGAEDNLYMQAETAESECDDLSYFDDFVSNLRRQGAEIIDIIEDGSPDTEIEFVDIYNPDYTDDNDCDYESEEN